MDIDCFWLLLLEGSMFGGASYCTELIRLQLQVNGWVHSINILAKAARKSPLVFATMAKSLQLEWSYVFGNCGHLLPQLHDGTFSWLHLFLIFCAGDLVFSYQ